MPFFRNSQPNRTFNADETAMRSYSSPRESPRAKCLYLINCNAGRTISHWGLFLPYSSNSGSYGTFWDMIIDTDSKSSGCFGSMFVRHGAKRKYKSRKIEDFDLDRAYETGKIAMDIGFPQSTPDRIDAACALVAKEFRYNFAHENCQTFVIEILKVLHAWNPNMVPYQAIKIAEGHAPFTVRKASAKKQPIKLDNERPIFMSEANEANEQWLAASTARLSPRTVPLSERTMRNGAKLEPLSRAIAGRRGHASEPLAVAPQDYGRAPRRQAYSDPRPCAPHPRRTGARSDPPPESRRDARPERPPAKYLWGQLALSEDGDLYVRMPGAWD